MGISSTPGKEERKRVKKKLFVTVTVVMMQVERQY